MTTKTEMSTRIKALRKERRETQQDAANRIGVPKSTYASWEAGSLTTDAAVLLVEYFGITFDELFTGKKAPVHPESRACGSLSKEESHLLRLYRRCSLQDQKEILLATSIAAEEER